MVSASARKRFSRPRLRGHCLAAFALLLTALLCGIAASSAWAQMVNPTWDGEIEVSLDGKNGVPTPIQMNFDASNEFTYWIRLTVPPVYRDGEQESPWWIRIFVDGVVHIDGDYKDIKWVPSVGHEFDKDTSETWRQVTFRIDDEAKAESPEIEITHEVWATQQWCPLHNTSPITLNVDGDTENTENTENNALNNPPEFPANTDTRSCPKPTATSLRDRR